MNLVQALELWAQNLLLEAATMAILASVVAAILTPLVKKWGVEDHPLKIFGIVFVLALVVQYFG